MHQKYCSSRECLYACEACGSGAIVSIRRAVTANSGYQPPHRLATALTSLYHIYICMYVPTYLYATGSTPYPPFKCSGTYISSRCCWFCEYCKILCEFLFCKLQHFFVTIIYIYSNILLFFYFSQRRRSVISTKVFCRVRTFIPLWLILVCIFKIFRVLLLLLSLFLPQSIW